MVVDASLWVADALYGDAHHSIASAWIVSHRSTDLAVPTLALAEVAGAVARRSSAAVAVRAVQDMRVIPHIQIVPLDEQLALEAARLAATHRLRGADAVYVAVAARLRMTLVTLDGELAGRVQAVVSVLQP